MRILAFDTAGHGCSACVWQDGVVLAQRQQDMERGQAEALVPLLGQVLAEAGLGWGDLDRVAVSRGPGSFTGLRVGLSTARALALAAGLPVLGLTTLEAFATAAQAAIEKTAAQAAIKEPPAQAAIKEPPAQEEAPMQGGALLALVDARRDDLYCQVFDAATLAPLTSPRSVRVEDIPALLAACEITGPVYACGDAQTLAAPLLADGVVAGWLGAALVDPQVLARLAAARSPEQSPPEALYIRPPDAALPVNGGQLRPA